MANDRIVAFDIGRAICMLYIVGIWHMQEYTIYNGILPGYLYEITLGAMSYFTFASGFLNARNYTSAKQFYVKRFCRFFALYLLADTLMFILGLEVLYQYIGSLFGITNFILPQPMTLWYISMLILFYALTPYLLAAKKRSGMLLRGVFIIFIFYSLTQWGVLDYRTEFYFVFYLLGLSIPKEYLERISSRKYNLFIVCSLFLLLCSDKNINNYNYNYIEVSAIVILICSITFIISALNNKKILFVFKGLSYVSMCAYMFHRVVYKVLKDDFFVSVNALSLEYVPIMVLVLLGVSFILQYSYDKYVFPYLSRLSSTIIVK